MFDTSKINKEQNDCKFCYISQRKIISPSESVVIYNCMRRLISI